MTGLKIAQRMIRLLPGVTAGVGTCDWYEPRIRHVHLSPRTARGEDMRALACAAHEAAHAVQHVRLHGISFRVWQSWLVQSPLVPIGLFSATLAAVAMKWHPWPVAIFAACVALGRVAAVMLMEWEASTIALGWLKLYGFEHPDSAHYLRRLWRSYLWIAIGL
jgi:Zn-dependent membrane protease YugP